MVIDVWPWKPRNAELSRIVWMLNRSHNWTFDTLVLIQFDCLLIYILADLCIQKKCWIYLLLSRSLFCITVIFHHSSQPYISPTPFIILDHLDHGHPPSRLALAFGTNHRVHGRHFSLAPFRWANPQWCFLGSVRWNAFFMYLFSDTGKFIIYVYIYLQLSISIICKCTSIKNNQNTFIIQHLSEYLS